MEQLMKVNMKCGQVVQVMNVLRTPHTAREVVEMTDVPVAQVHRIINEMNDLGLVEVQDVERTSHHPTRIWIATVVLRLESNRKLDFYRERSSRTI